MNTKGTTRRTETSLTTWFGNVRNSPPHKAPTTKKNGAPINPKRRTEPMSQIFISLTFHIKRPGGMREAVRRPTGDGVLDTNLDLLGSGPRFSGNFGILVPPYYSPQGPCTFRRADPKLPVCWSMFASKNASKISIDFWMHFGSQNDPKSFPKSIQNPLKNLLKFWLIFDRFLIGFSS